MTYPSEEIIAEHEPVIFDHSAIKKTTVYRLKPCEAKGGANDYITFWALRRGEPVEGERVSWELVRGPGVGLPETIWSGLTNERGYIKWLHHRNRVRYQVSYRGCLVVANLSIGCPWKEWCNPSRPGEPFLGRHGWRPINTPGHYGYVVTFDLR